MFQLNKSKQQTKKTHMKSIFAIIVILITCIGGCMAQFEKGLMQVESSHFKNGLPTHETKNYIEVSPYYMLFYWDALTPDKRIIYALKDPEITSQTTSLRITGKAEGYELTLYYEDGEMVGGIIERNVIEGTRKNQYITEFARIQPTYKRRR